MRMGIAAVGLALLAGVASAAEVTKDWTIVYPDVASGAEAGVENCLRRLAADLADDFEEATGWKLSVIRQSKAAAGTRGLWLGAPAAKQAGFDLAGWKRMRNAYAAKDGSVYCFGNDRQGSKAMKPTETYKVMLPSGRAAMRFMRDVVGARYVMPRRTGTFVPKRESISLADGAFRDEDPWVFFGSSRGPQPYAYANADFPRGVTHDYGGHSFDLAVPDSLYATHPEYVGMDKSGKRVRRDGLQPLCISNPEVQELVFQEAKRHFDDGAEICQIAQNDGNPHCFCPKCRDLYGTGDDWNEKLWIFFRGIAERCERECPGKIVHFLAYYITAQPPKTFKAFPKNTMIQLCTYDEETFRKWSEITVPQGFSAYLYLWGNYRPLGNTPKRSFAGLAELVDRLRRYNVQGVYRCGSGGELFGLEGPQYYYFNRLLENPKAGIAETLKEFCDAAFGAEAGEPMFRFYEALDVRLRVNDRISMGHFEADAPDVSKWTKADQSKRLDLLAYIYTADVVSTMDGCLAHAKRCRMTDRERTRLKRVEVEWSYARNLGRIANLYNGYKAAPSYERLEPLLDEIEWRNAFIERVYAPRPKDAKAPDWLWIPLFAGCPREQLYRNSRLAPIYEPLDWDVAAMRRDRVAPGAPGEVERWKKYNAEKGLKPLAGWKLTNVRPEQRERGFFFEVRPDGRGFAFDPQAAMDLRVGTTVGPKDGIKPDTRYRVSWFAKLEDVQVKPSFRNFGFYASVRAGTKNDVFEPSGGVGLTGSCDWRHMSMTFRTGDNPKAWSSIIFRLLSGRGRVEVEDVTIEEIE